MVKVMDAYLGLLALRQAGYRSTGTAISELVDNSIQANAANIDIILGSDNVLAKARKIEQITAIGVLDNGDGMDFSVLESCLSMGWGTRLDATTGLGRFGYGLKGSSISQCQRVEVYSWQKGTNAQMTYLDFDDLKERSGENELPAPKLKQLPKWIRKGFKEKIGDSGTLVLWTKIDQANVKKPLTLINRLNSELCRAYRHFLDDNEEYGTKRIITVHTYHLVKNKVEHTYLLQPNDPLYLLTPNNLPNFGKEATNIVQDSYSFDVEYLQPGDEKIQISPITITTSIAKPEIQSLGGNSDVGKHYANNTGISFVRAGREIDLQPYGYIDRSEPRHRWWGLEVRFEPALDDYFGITNNKQDVRHIKKLSEEEMSEMSETDELSDKMLLTLNKHLVDQISKMIKVVQHRKEGSKTVVKGKGKGLSARVNEEVGKNRGEKTESGQKAKDKTVQVKIQERTTLLMNDDGNLSKDEATELAKATLNSLIDISLHEWPGDIFLDRQPVANGSAAVINRGTAFYRDFWCYLDNLDDPKGHEALQVILMAMIRAEDELVTRYPKEVFSVFRAKWGEWVARLIPIVTSKK